MAMCEWITNIVQIISQQVLCVYGHVPVLSLEKGGEDKQSTVKELPKPYYKSTVWIVGLGQPNIWSLVQVFHHNKLFQRTKK